MPNRQECPVCAETVRKDLIECPRCAYKACSSCIRTYLLGSHFDAHCMNCRHTLDRRFMSHHFPRSFITTEFKKHRADVLLERERSLFPETMARVQNDLLQERLLAEMALIEKKRRELTSELVRVRHQLYRAQHPVQGPSGPSGQSKPLSVRPCIHEGCKGYLDEQTGECGLCLQTTCLECNVAKEPSHACRQEDKDSWVLIRSSTKPCPRCHARIHRISGCRQMWCPVCHSAFDYLTGKMETGVIHNPHYFEYLHRTGAEAQANPHAPYQGGLLQLQRAVKTQHDREAWYQFYRAITHVRHIEMPKRRDATLLPFHDTTLDLRKQFMRNQLDETTYKKRIQEREKKWLKDKDLFTVMQTFVEVGADLVQSLRHEEEPDVWQVKAVQRSSLRVFFNDSVQDINFQYQSKVPVLNEFFILQTL